MSHTHQTAALDAAPSAATLRIVECGIADGGRWDRFVRGSTRGSFYHLFAWKNLCESVFGHRTFYLAALDAKDEIRGVFPLVFVKSRLFGRILCSMPFLNFGGPCAEDTETTAALLARAKSVARDVRADYLEIRALQSVDDALPTSLRKISLTLDLPADPNTLWESFDTKHRTNVRRAYKNNFRVEHGRHDQLDAFYTVMAHSWREHGTPLYRKAAFAKILDAFPDETRIFVVYHGDTPAAAALNGYCHGTVEGMWLGIHPALRQLQANTVLYWDMIQDACTRGFKTYHLGRSSADSGAETFKKKWNARAVQLYWQYDLCKRDSIPELNPDNPKYQLAIKLWRQLPLPVLGVIGPPLANNIP